MVRIGGLLHGENDGPRRQAHLDLRLSVPCPILTGRRADRAARVHTEFAITTGYGEMWAKRGQKTPKTYSEMVGAEGFEPPTAGV